ncbi:ly6/PLAUR domain-containing protein 2-like [Lissotriton helveticus]
MKPSLIVLLAAALHAQLVDALLCYYCPMQMLAAECTEIRNCTGQLQWCQTKLYSDEIAYPYPADGGVVKGCVKDCKPSDDSIGVQHPTFCCNSDLCNRAGINGTRDDANSKEISYALLTASAGLISVLHQTGL